MWRNIRILWCKGTKNSYYKIITKPPSRYKTGDFPPTDIQFEEMSLRREKRSSSLTRRRARSNMSQKREKQNLFQKKRKLLKTIEKHRNAITKGLVQSCHLNILIFNSCSRNKINTCTTTHDLTLEMLPSFRRSLILSVKRSKNLSKN